MTRGRKPKPAYLKLVSGNPGRRPIFPDAAANLDPAADNGLEPPVKLKKRQRQLWDTYIRRCPWLTPLDVPIAYAWTEIFAEFERDPRMLAARVVQLRALSASLGLDVSARARIAPAQPGDDPVARKYLT